MTRGADWLAAYLRAWSSKDDADVRAVFTDDAQYWFRPDDSEPVRGIDAILAMWGNPEPGVAEPSLSVLIERDDLAIITGSVDYPGHERYLNMWEVWLAPDGRARKFVEWFMTAKGG